MFIATRIANGIIALLALITSVMLMLGGGSTMRMASVVLALVALLFVGDIRFRKKNSSSDMVFAVVWTLMFAFAVYQGLLVLSGMPADVIAEDATVMYGTFIGIYVIPCVLNSVHLVRLFLQKRNAA